MADFIYLTKPIKKYSSLRALDVGMVISRRPDSIYVLFLREKLKVEIPIEQVKAFDISKVGDRFDFKICDRCCRFLETKIHFSGNRLKKNNVITNRPSCKECRKVKEGVQIPAKEKKLWEQKRPKKFSLFTCPLCEKMTIVGHSKVVLDHNHHNGRVRGYLCESCNTGIGRFDDNIAQVERAIDWLKQK